MLFSDWLRAGADLIPAQKDALLDQFIALAMAPGGLQRSVADMAMELGVSASWLRGRCHDVMGTSPGRVMRSLRLERAAVLLLEGPRPIADIAVEVGYASATHFHAAFKERFGMSPGGWRDQED